ncbi:MAG TPA: hypothetical protein VLA01_01135 [Nitrosopumilaceae archaeon]|nr:hypothetical protein [Nitrosopumilaceae archaeon]
MTSRAPLLSVLLAFATVTFSMAYAAGQPQIDLTSTGNSEIDLLWEEKDRMVRTWTQFSNFNPNDGSFVMQIVQSETGKIVSESTINVMTNSENSLISFNTFVLYAVNAEDICENEEFDAGTMPLEDCNPVTGQYEMMVSTNDGRVIESVPFTIIDTRT